MFGRLKVEFVNYIPGYNGDPGLVPVARVDEHTRFHC
jgi:hypothetical protein